MVTIFHYFWNVIKLQIQCLVFILILIGDTEEQDSCHSKQILMNAGQEKGQENPLVLDDWDYTFNVCLWGCSNQIVSIIWGAKSHLFYRVELKTAMINDGGAQLSGRKRPCGHAVMWARVYWTKCLYSVACLAVSTSVKPEKENWSETRK